MKWQIGGRAKSTNLQLNQINYKGVNAFLILDYLNIKGCSYVLGGGIYESVRSPPTGLIFRLQCMYTVFIYDVCVYRTEIGVSVYGFRPREF